MACSHELPSPPERLDVEGGREREPPLPSIRTDLGGATDEAGSASAQDFPVDAESIALFTREGLDVSLTNVWRVEVDPASASDAAFAYQLTRANDPTRLFRVEFDASDPVSPPPPAWGW